MQNVLLSEKRTLDRLATVQFCFSLARVRCFWCCFSFGSGSVALFFWRCLSMVTLDELTPASVHSLWQYWQYSQACSHPCCLCTFPYPISSFQSTLHLICFDTALCEHTPLSVMTLCDLSSLWMVSMLIFWTIAKSAGFPIIVISKNKRYTGIYTVRIVI